MILNEKKTKIILFCSFLTIAYFVIVLTLHYEYKKLSQVLLIIAYIFAGFWGLVVLFMLILILVGFGFVIMQFICMECCSSRTSSQEEILYNEEEGDII